MSDKAVGSGSSTESLTIHMEKHDGFPDLALTSSGPFRELTCKLKNFFFVPPSPFVTLKFKYNISLKMLYLTLSENNFEFYIFSIFIFSTFCISNLWFDINTKDRLKRITPLGREKFGEIYVFKVMLKVLVICFILYCVQNKIYSLSPFCMVSRKK